MRAHVENVAGVKIPKFERVTGAEAAAVGGGGSSRMDLTGLGAGGMALGKSREVRCHGHDRALCCLCAAALPRLCPCKSYGAPMALGGACEAPCSEWPTRVLQLAPASCTLGQAARGLTSAVCAAETVPVCVRVW